MMYASHCPGTLLFRHRGSWNDTVVGKFDNQAEVSRVLLVERPLATRHARCRRFVHTVNNDDSKASKIG